MSDQRLVLTAPRPGPQTPCDLGDVTGHGGMLRGMSTALKFFRRREPNP